jgi:DNA replication and repair protein RecF
MYLSSIFLSNFKNYREEEVTFSPKINCFYGLNGSGKTNILDAVYYLSFCKSYLNVVDRQNVRFDESYFAINGNWIKENHSYTIQCSLKVGGKKIIKKNKKEYEKLADHIGLFPVVMISPYDRDLLSEGSELRRKWIDSIISQFDKDYLNTLQRYKKVLDQRNALLKNMHEHGLFDRESIEVWNEQLVQSGTIIHQKRLNFIEEFLPVFQERYNFIGLVEEEVQISYKSQLNDAPFEELLKQFERKDAFSQHTNCGTHKDDLVFTIKGHAIKKFGSQGQQKSFVIALRLAQYEWLKNYLEVAPVLLLDDIFDKLDATRVKRLMELVSNHYFGQIIITDTEEGRLRDLFGNLAIERKFFHVEQGHVTEINELGDH